MYARVATFEGGDPARADEVIEAVRGMIRERGSEIQGARRFMMLIDREAGRTRAITVFDEEQAMLDAESIFDQMTPAVPDAGATRASVEHFEVALDEQLA